MSRNFTIIGLDDLAHSEVSQEPGNTRDHHWGQLRILNLLFNVDQPPSYWLYSSISIVNQWVYVWTNVCHNMQHVGRPTAGHCWDCSLQLAHQGLTCPTSRPDVPHKGQLGLSWQFCDGHTDRQTIHIVYNISIMIKGERYSLKEHPVKLLKNNLPKTVYSVFTFSNLW